MDIKEVLEAKTCPYIYAEHVDDEGLTFAFRGNLYEIQALIATLVKTVCIKTDYPLSDFLTEMVSAMAESEEILARERRTN